MAKKKKIEFKNEYTLDIKKYQEFNQAYHLNNILFIPIIFICLLLLLFLGLYESLEKITFFLLFFSIIYYILSKIALKLNLNRMCLSRNSLEIKTSFIVNENGVTLLDKKTENKITYEYSQIKGIMETPSLIILKLKYRMGIILAKDNLTSETVTELKDYLKDMTKISKIKTLSPKHKYLFPISFIFIVLIFITSLFLDHQNSKFYEKIIPLLEKNNYEVELYSGRESELIVYGITNPLEHHLSYLYVFQDLDLAQDNFEDWLNFEIILNSPNCKTKNNYEMCTLKEEDKYLVIVRNYKTIFYSETTPEYQDEIETILKKINYLK